MARVYIRPIGLAAAPQDESAGATLRLAGGMVWASRFALIVRADDGAIVSRRVLGPLAMPEALAALPAPLVAEGAAQWAALGRPRPALRCGERTIRLDQPQVVGILNLTPDSFSDGGRFADPARARVHGAAMLETGAAIIDVGGESTRPGAAPVWEGDERARVIPVIAALAAGGGAISIDTRNAAVMAAALAAGVTIVNDVSALRHDPASLAIVARAQVPVVLMHAPGEGGDPHAGGSYRDVVLDVFDWLRARRDAALAGGIAGERIILDPGIGFGKSLAENLALINGLALFHALGSPVMAGASRKRLIGALADEATPDRRLGGSLLLAGKALDAGVQLLRVHDVAETVQALRVWRGLRDAALADFSQTARED